MPAQVVVAVPVDRRAGHDADGERDGGEAEHEHQGAGARVDDESGKPRGESRVTAVEALLGDRRACTATASHTGALNKWRPAGSPGRPAGWSRGAGEGAPPTARRTRRGRQPGCGPHRALLATPPDDRATSAPRSIRAIRSSISTLARIGFRSTSAITRPASTRSSSRSSTSTRGASRSPTDRSRASGSTRQAW
jgi:hypothetical protein